MFLLSKYVYSLLQDAEGKSPEQVREIIRRVGYEMDIYETKRNYTLYIVYNLYNGDSILLRFSKEGEWKKE